MLKQILASLVLLLVLAVPSVGKAGVILPPGLSIQYGDFTAYSMALQQFALDGTLNMGSTDYFYIETSPGQIHDDIVVMTGAGGTATDNGDISPLIDDAFEAHSGTDLDHYTFVGRETDPEFYADGDRSAANGDGMDSWEASAGAISTFLGSDDLVFWFNLNENGTASELDGQDLLAWAEVKLYDATGADTGHTFYLTGDNSPTGPINKYGRTDWGYVHSEITVDPATRTPIHFGPPTDDEKALGYVSLDQNLGARKAAFGVFNQELNDLVKANPDWTLSTKIELGDVNNGYEQVIIRGATIIDPPPIPEPASVAIWGVMVVGLGFNSSRRRRRA